MAKAWSIEDIPDLNGRRVVITGGNSGIGLAAATALARCGADVTITSRDGARGAAALAAIRRRAPSARVECQTLDLADLASVRGFAAIIVAGGELDLLINNAGVMALPRRQTTRDGFEMQLGTNHLGHFALTGLLLPALATAPSARVITVSSVAHRRGEIRFSDLQLERSYTPWAAYTQSKLANLMFALELQRRLTRAGLYAASLAAHPGFAETNLAASGPMQGGAPVAGAAMQVAFRLFGQSAARGALPILMAATAPNLTGGSYIGPDGWREARGNPAPATIALAARDTGGAAELWRRSERLTGVAWLSDAQ